MDAEGPGNRPLSVPHGAPYSPDKAATVINDNGLALDIEALVMAASETDVLVIGFDFVAERVVIDFRADRAGHTLPLLELAHPLDDDRARLAWLNDRRPALTAPGSYLYFVWPHSIGMLTRSAVAERIVSRLQEAHDVDYRPVLARIAVDLRRAERAEQVAAIRGLDGFDTLWSRDE